MPQVSPPKPWERAGATASPISAVMATPPPTQAGASASAPPSLPARPAGLTSAATTTGINRTGMTGMAGMAGMTGMASSMSPYGRSGYSSGYGMGSGYGSYGSYGGGYGSSYSRFGGLGGYGGYGGMGGYGSMGGYGMGMGGMGGMGGNMDPNDPNSLMRGMEHSTAATFQMIESIVSAFGSFAQMLESTFMATHSSFFAMVSVAEQFGNLRNTLGQILGIFAVIRWTKIGFAKLTGGPLPVSAGDLTPEAFANFGGGGGSGARGGSPNRPPRGPSKKPFIVFCLAVFGLPYLMGKLIRALASKQEEEERKRQKAMEAAAGGQMLELADPMKQLDFCRVMYDFAPENPAVELEAKKGDIVAVLSKSDPLGNQSQWWKCRTRDARVGYLPEPYLEAVVRNGQAVGSLKQITDVSGSRTVSLTNASVKATSSESRTQSLTSTKPGDISIESFQKSGFY